MNEFTPVSFASASLTIPVDRADHSAEPNCGRAPMGLLAELTHKCPLQCPYCSNPLDMDKPNTELSTADWQRVFREAAQLGILQLHLSGGEPTVRRDLEELVKTASEVVRRHEQHLQALLHKTEWIDTASGRVLVKLDVVPDEDDPHAVLSAQDADGRELARWRVAASTQLNARSALAWAEKEFARPG